MEFSLIELLSAIATPIGLVLVAVINWWAASDARKSAQEALQTAKLSITKIDQVHTIVNSQNTRLLQVVADLTARIARDNPSDDGAQTAAAEAASNVKAKRIADQKSSS